MSGSDQDNGVPFQIGDWVIDLQKAGERGQYTGKSRKAGPNVMVELRYPDGRQMQRPLRSLKAAPDEGGSSIESRLQSGAFGRVRDKPTHRRAPHKGWSYPRAATRHDSGAQRPGISAWKVCSKGGTLLRAHADPEECD